MELKENSSELESLEKAKNYNLNAAAGHKKTASNQWGGNGRKRRNKRRKHSGNGLCGFSQHSFAARVALFQLVVERVHGAKLPIRFCAARLSLSGKIFGHFW
jgi:hypothetical protein